MGEDCQKYKLPVIRQLHFRDVMYSVVTKVNSVSLYI